MPFNRGKRGKQGKKYTRPWEMTFEEFMGFDVPSPMSDKSRSPKDVEQLRSEGGLLSDYSGDDFTLNEFLGKGYDRRYDVTHLKGAVKQNRPVKIYRATDTEQEIWPGAYVTLSRNYAADHGDRNHQGSFSLLEDEATPDELVAMNPNEFFYVPKDMKGYHRKHVERAIQDGEDVPESVLAEHSEDID